MKPGDMAHLGNAFGDPIRADEDPDFPRIDHVRLAAAVGQGLRALREPAPPFAPVPVDQLRLRHLMLANNGRRLLERYAALSPTSAMADVINDLHDWLEELERFANEPERLAAVARNLGDQINDRPTGSG